MKALKIQFLMALMLIAGGWLQAQTVTVGPWTFYPSPLGGTMQGQAQINGIVAAAEDVIAAFEPGGECVGAKLMTMSGGVAYINFIIYGDDQLGGNHGMNPGENFTLKIRDSSAHCTYVYYPSLSGWQNTSFMPMPGYNNFNAVFNFLPCTLSTSTTSLSLPPSPAGTTTFNITTYCDWTISESLSWLSVSPASGTGDATITVTYDANTGAQRTGNIGVNVNCTTPVTIDVTQSGVVTNTVSPSNQNVTSAAGSTTFAVTSASTWTVTDNVSWLSVTPTSGSGDGTLTASYTANNTGSVRTATITVTFAGSTPSPISVTVTQAACSLTVTPTVQNVTCAAGTTTFSINSTCSWTVTESASWFSVSPTSGTGNGTLTVTYDANSGADRTANITVSVTGLTPVTITVNQTGCCPLSVTPASQSVTPCAGTTSFSVVTNSTCAWTVTESISWLSVSPTSGTGNATLTVTYDANAGVARSGNITVAITGGTSSTVSVNQSACTVTVTPANRDVTYLSGTTTFAITTCSNWTVSDNATWLAVSPPSGTGSATITATYSSNSGTTTRVATITVSGCGGTVTVPVTVTQTPPPPSTYTITITSQNPTSGVPVTVSPNDNSGNGNGTTQFTRTYNSGTNVTLTAPINPTGSTNVFSKWLKNGADFSTNQAITFSTTAADTYTAVYVTTPPSVPVSFPDTTVMAGTSLEIPVYVGNLTGLNILAFQFNFTFDQTVIVPVDPYIITSGTISSDTGWSVIPNPNVPGQMTIGGIGTDPLVGGGILLAIKFNVIGTYGEESPLDLTSFTFNDGILSVTLTDGSVTIPPKVCGDADQNNLIQAYDAALTLQHAIGLIVLPVQGALNADVNEDDAITAWDATLTLRHSIGLPMPAGITTCFATDDGKGDKLPEIYVFKAKLNNMIRIGDLSVADIVLGGINETGKVYSVSFDLTSPTATIQNLTMPNLPNGYLMFMNPTDAHTYRVGIINTNGVLTNDMKMHISMTGFNDGSKLTMSNIILNDHNMPDIKLAGNTNSVNPITGSLVAYPNPFNSVTNITYQVIEDSPVRLEIFDMFGTNANLIQNSRIGHNNPSVFTA